MSRDFAEKLARRQLYSHVPEAEDGTALPDYLGRTDRQPESGD